MCNSAVDVTFILSVSCKILVSFRANVKGFACQYVREINGAFIPLDSFHNVCVIQVIPQGLIFLYKIDYRFKTAAYWRFFESMNTYTPALVYQADCSQRISRSPIKHML